MRLVRRPDDGLTGREGYFTARALWLVEAMARAGFAEEAQIMFEKLHRKP
jgi:hypothetical protein